MIVPTNIPPDPLGWRWYIPAMIIGLIAASVPMMTERDATRGQFAFAVVWLVVWMFVAIGLRFFLGWVYQDPL